MEIEAWALATVIAAGFGAGFINTVVGSGSLLTFPALLLAGVPPVTANASNTVGLTAGNVMGAWGYRRELLAAKRLAIPLLIITVISAAFGAFALLTFPPAAFSIIAPWLIGIGTALVLAQPLLQSQARRKPARAEGPLRSRIAYATTVLTGAYGGYFGAAQGVLIVGILGALFDRPVHTINAIKNLLQTAAGAVASCIFIATGSIDPLAVITLGASSIAGALVGVRIGRRMPAWLFRAIVVAVGVGSIILLLK